MLTRPVLRTVRFDPGNYGLEKPQVDWLRDKLGANPTVDDLFVLEREGGLNDTQRRIVDGLKRSVLGTLRKRTRCDLSPTIEVWTRRHRRSPVP